MSLDWTIEPIGDAGELNLLYKSWKACLITEGGYSHGVIFDFIDRAMDKLQDREARFLCARNPGRPSQVFGVSVLEEDVAHFVYVKRWFRRMGVGRALVGDCRYTTLWTQSANAFVVALNLRRIDL